MEDDSLDRDTCKVVWKVEKVVDKVDRVNEKTFMKCCAWTICDSGGKVSVAEEWSLDKSCLEC